MESILDMVSGELDFGIKERLGQTIVRDGLWVEAIALAVHSDARIVFRVAWGLDWAYFHSREGLIGCLDSFVDAFVMSENGSVHRQYLHILTDIQRRRIVVFDDNCLARIVEKCFGLLIRDKTKAAVKVGCIDFLVDALPRVDWAKGVLCELLDNIIMDGDTSPGLANKVRKVRRAIRDR